MSEPSDEGWGVLASVKVPGYGPIGLYEPCAGRERDQRRRGPARLVGAASTT